MIRSDLIARIAEQNPHLYAKDVERVVDAILDRIAGALAKDDRVELRDFGSLALWERRARTGCDPRSDRTVAVAAKQAI